MYLNPLHRLTPYLFGVGLGYILSCWAHHIKLTQVGKFCFKTSYVRFCYINLRTCSFLYNFISNLCIFIEKYLCLDVFRRDSSLAG